LHCPAQLRNSCSKAASSSAPELSEAHGKASLFLFLLMVTRHSSVDRTTVAVQEQRGCIRDPVEYGVSKGASSSAQALSVLHVKATLFLFLLMVIRQSSVESTTTAKQEQRGCLRDLAEYGVSKAASSSAQALSVLHVKAPLFLFLLMAIRQSSVEIMTIAM
jgi:hypothetical protein